MQIQKTNSLPQTLRNLSQTELCKRIAAADFKGVSDQLPNTIQGAIESPRINDLISIHGKGQINLCVQYELIKTTALVSVGNKLNDAQVQFIATQLIEFFPNETLADFKLCFQRGCMGQYGDIFRLDGIVLRKWMEQYLDEKYQVIEHNLIKEKDNYHNVKPDPSGKDWLQIWLDEVQKLPGQPVMPLTEEEIRKEGQEQPPKKVAHTRGYKYFKVKNVQVLAMTQEHAEDIVKRMIASGELEEYE